MANVTTTGLAAVKMGDIAVDGGMGTTLAVIGYTNKGSVQLNTEDPQLTEFYAEEVDDPIYISKKKGKTTFTFQLGFPDFDQMVAVLGGTKTGSGNTQKWTAPSTYPTIEKSWKVVPTNGLVLNIPRGSIQAKLTGGYMSTDNLKIDVVITVLTPTKANEPPYFTSLLAGEA